MRIRDSPTNVSLSGAAENEEQNQPKQIQTGTDKSRQIYTKGLKHDFKMLFKN